MTISVVDACADLLEKAMILATELQDGCHKGLPEVDQFQDRVWTLSERLDNWNEVWRNGIYSDEHLWRILKVAEDMLKTLQKCLRSWFERGKKKAISTLIELSKVLDRILETGDASTQQPAGMVTDHILPIDSLMAGSNLMTQEALNDAEGPRAVTIFGGLGTKTSRIMEKAMIFTTHLQLQECYKQTAELDEFQNMVWLLSGNYAQCSSRLLENTISKHGHLFRALMVFEKILETEVRYARSRSRSSRRKKKVFPSQFLYVLNEILESAGIVQYGTLPFRPDIRHVPISASIQEVREALEDENGPSMVTVDGGPGSGKTGLVRHLVISYMQSDKPVHFSGGVHYFFCGQGASQRVRTLQREVLKSLGLVTESTAQPDNMMVAVEGEYTVIPSYERIVSSGLSQREGKGLIIFDDVWESEILKQLFVPSERVKYLVTSQLGDICGTEICSAAKTITMKWPTLIEARQILVNYTEGLSTKGKLPLRIQSVVDDIIEKLEYHPLSLSNLGLSINRRQATSVSHWGKIAGHLQTLLVEQLPSYKIDPSLLDWLKRLQPLTPCDLLTRAGGFARCLIVDDKEETSSSHQREGTWLQVHTVDNLEASRRLDRGSYIPRSLDCVRSLDRSMSADNYPSPRDNELGLSPEFRGWKPKRLYV